MSRSPLLGGSVHGSEDSLWYGAISSPESLEVPELLVYFVPGNPCLISYYNRFLARLSKLLNTDYDGNEQTVLVGGYSLPGFQTFRPAIMNCDLPANLEDEILNVEKLLLQTLNNLCSTRNGNRERLPTKVILVAHSVGAYMTLEVLRRRICQLNGLQNVDIIGAVLLFPTVTEIAESRNGKIFMWLQRIPYFPAIMAKLALIVTYFISVSTLARIVCYLGSVPDHIGNALANWLKSPMGVYQALHLTINEMKMIREDRWNENVWGSLSAEKNQDSVPLRFHFGEEDVWVSSKHRDELIERRARRDSDGATSRKPVMAIDREKIPHDFIVWHSERIAERTKAMIDDLRRLDRIKSN